MLICVYISVKLCPNVGLYETSVLTSASLRLYYTLPYAIFIVCELTFVWKSAWDP